MYVGSASHDREKLKWYAKAELNNARVGKYEHVSPEILDAYFSKKEALNLTACKNIIAKKYWSHPQDTFGHIKALEEFARENFQAGLWKSGFDNTWRESIYKRQLDAIVKSEGTGLDLKSCGDELGVNFEGFSFSYMTFLEAFHPRGGALRAIKPIDFSGVKADGCLIEAVWSCVFVSFREASLQHAKFYTLMRDGRIVPGTNFYNTDFSFSNLKGADFRCSYLKGCKFEGAQLEGADFTGSNLIGAGFGGAVGAYKC